MMEVYVLMYKKYKLILIFNAFFKVLLLENQKCLIVSFISNIFIR